MGGGRGGEGSPAVSQGRNAPETYLVVVCTLSYLSTSLTPSRTGHKRCSLLARLPCQLSLCSPHLLHSIPPHSSPPLGLSSPTPPHSSSVSSPLSHLSMPTVCAGSTGDPRPCSCTTFVPMLPPMAVTCEECGHSQSKHQPKSKTSTYVSRLLKQMDNAVAHEQARVETVQGFRPRAASSTAGPVGKVRLSLQFPLCIILTFRFVCCVLREGQRPLCHVGPPIALPLVKVQARTSGLDVSYCSHVASRCVEPSIAQ